MIRTPLPILARRVAILSLYCFIAGASCTPVTDLAPEHPDIRAGVPFFYYQDLQTAANWYEDKLGLRKVVSRDWVVIFELNAYSQIGLVNATGGSLAPADEKGVLLSIEVDNLEGWYEYLSTKDGIDMIHGIEVGAQGMIEEFRMTDPGGYVIEFFRWKLQPEDRLQ